jgi:hypothetical protein
VRGQFSKWLIRHSGPSSNDLAHGSVFQRLDDTVIENAPKKRPMRDAKLQQRFHPDHKRLRCRALYGF